MTYPTIMPALTLDFQNSQQLDPRVTFSRSSGATYINSAGLVTSAADHEARFDHDPVTGECLGLLMEESRVNSQKWSSDFSQTSSYSLINNGDGAVPVLDSTLYEAPDGSATAQRWTLQITDTTDGGNQSGIQAGTSSIPAGAYVTVWAKSATGADQTVFLTSQANDTFTVTSKWQRFDLGPRSTIPFRAFARGTYTNAVVDILLWGVQIEAGTFPTSLIPTSGSTVTRSQDIAQMTGDNFSSWYNESEATIVSTQIDADSGTGYGVVWGFGTGGKNRIELRQRSQEFRRGFYINGPSGGNISAVPLVYTKTSHAQQYTVGVAINASGADYAAEGVGVAGNTFTNATMPVIGTLYLSLGTQVDIASKTIARLTYYNQRLTDAELQTLTS